MNTDLVTLLRDSIQEERERNTKIATERTVIATCTRCGGPLFLDDRGDVYCENCPEVS